MAEEFQAGICGGSWWNSTTSPFIGGLSPCSAGTYGSSTWQMMMGRSSCNKDSDDHHTVSVCDNSSLVFQNSQRPQSTDSDSGGSSILVDSSLPIIGFGLSSSSSSSSSDWNQALLSGNGRTESYNSGLQEEMNSGLNPSQIQKDWSPDQDSSINNSFKGINQDFSMEQQGLNSSCTDSITTCQGLSSTGFSIEPSAVSYGYPSTLIQSLFEPDPEPQQPVFTTRSMNNYYGSSNNNLNDFSPSWPSKISPTCFLKPSSLLPKQHQNSLHFSNNTPFWNASATATNSIRPNFLPSSQPQFLGSNFDEKSNFPNLTQNKANNLEIRETGSLAKKGSEPAFKRPRIETPSPLPTFKVRKEKLGDRITALQQLVSPFGKTDTASVLHEAIEYIKYLHEQVLSTPYLKNGNPIQHQQGTEKLKEMEGGKQDLKSRGLCLVPISSTYPVANETTADFWTPTFGGTLR